MSDWSISSRRSLNRACAALVAAVCILALALTPVLAQGAEGADTAVSGQGNETSGQSGDLGGGESLPSAADLVQAAHDYWRGQSSESVMEMTIHRPDWERTMVLKVWTKGEDKSLFRVLEPARDKDNATLKIGRDMWSYNPRVNRVISIPPSMMSQAWMGSDFSNDDLSKSDSILVDYEHTVVSAEVRDGIRIFVIESLPLPQAPVVWGKLRLTVREDYILLSEEFFDEDGALVKVMTGEDIQMLGGRLLPRVWRMRRADIEDEYTELVYREVQFDADVSDRMFTQDSLRNPR